MTSRNYLDSYGYGPHPDENLTTAVLIGLLIAVAFVGGLVS